MKMDAASESRLNIRASAQQKEMLARAARAAHMNVSQFVLTVAMAAASKALAEEVRLEVPLEEFDELWKAMDEARPAPRLKEALMQPPTWDA